MQTVRNVTDDVLWIGGDDRDAHIFEGTIPIPEGMSYNSYLIDDGDLILMDTCDRSIEPQFWSNLMSALDGRSLGHLFVGHMEPDHSSCISRILETFPDVEVIASTRAFSMMEAFFGAMPRNKREIKEGDSVTVGKHTLRFVQAMMVHWPEVMFAYDEYDGTLYCEDAFGTFGTHDGCLFADECDFESKYMDEARRYYANIVGKYGEHVQKVLAKASGLKINRLCPLHGPIWRKDLGTILGKYDLWSRYEPEERGVSIIYSSMYGNTESVANLLAFKLKERGVQNVVVRRASETHPSYMVADAFRYSNLVFAAPTYNNELHPPVAHVIDDMRRMTVRNRKYSVIGNGSWGPQSQRIIMESMAAMQDMTLIGEPFVFKSSMQKEQMAELDALADAIAGSMQ